VHTYASIYLHVTFVTFDRRQDLVAELRPRVFQYIAATARNLGVEDVFVGGYDDHVHLFGRFDPAIAPAKVIGQIKQAATHWLREQGIAQFRWSRGYGAFSVSRDRINIVIRYIQNQETHHRRAKARRTI
jgi:REP element-mobilizing transposase RayT